MRRRRSDNVYTLSDFDRDRGRGQRRRLPKLPQLPEGLGTRVLFLGGGALIAIGAFLVVGAANFQQAFDLTRRPSNSDVGSAIAALGIASVVAGRRLSSDDPFRSRVAPLVVLGIVALLVLWALLSQPHLIPLLLVGAAVGALLFER